jgi:hypothetical protein
MYFVVVGGSIFQSGLVKSALSNGYQVICIDKNVKCYCFTNYQVVRVNLSLSDVTGVLAALTGYHVRGVATTQSDLGVPLVGAISDQFGLALPSESICRKFCDKFVFRSLCFHYKLANTAPTLVRSKNLIPKTAIRFPLAVKPADSSGSRGVSKVTRKSELMNAYYQALAHSKSQQVILEDWFEGVEFGCQACVNDNGVISFLFHEDYMYDFVPFAHRLIEPNDRAKELISTLVTSLRLRNCWMNVDLIETNSSIEILEIGLRLGATELDALCKYYIGISPYDLIVNAHYQFNVDYKKPSIVTGVLFSPFGFKYRIHDPLLFITLLEESGVTANLDYGFCGQIEPFVYGVKRFGSFTCEQQYSSSDYADVFRTALIASGEPCV